MNSRIALPSLLAALFFSGCQSENIKDILDICSKKFPSLPQDVVTKALSHSYDLKLRDEKCFASCMLTSAKLITNNDVNVPGWDAFHNIHWQEKAYRDIAHKNTLACKQETTGEQDPCEYAGKLINCFFVKNKEGKLPPPNLPYV